VVEESLVLNSPFSPSFSEGLHASLSIGGAQANRFRRFLIGGEEIPERECSFVFLFVGSFPCVDFSDESPQRTSSPF